MRNAELGTVRGSCEWNLGCSVFNFLIPHSVFRIPYSQTDNWPLLGAFLKLPALPVVADFT